MDAAHSHLQRRLAPLSVLIDLRHAWRVLDEIAPRVMRWLAIASLVDVIGVVGTPFVTKRIIDTVAAARDAGAVNALSGWVGAAVALALCGALSQRWVAHLTRVLQVRGPIALTARVLMKACHVAFTSFENQTFVNRLSRAREDGTVHFVPFATQTFTLGRAALILIGSLALLWTTSPWTLPVLLVATIPVFLLEVSVSRSAFALEQRHMHRNRQGWYLEWLLTAEQTAKELRALAVGRWLVGLYEKIHAPFRDGQLELARRQLPKSLGVTAISIVALNVPFAFVVAGAATGALSIGDMMLFMLAFQQASVAFGQLLGACARAFEQGLYVQNVLSMLDADESDREVDLDESELLPKAPQIVFDDVSFQYPGAPDPVLRGLDLEIRAGETLAILGRNGAGKTTLVKLLLGLYPLRGGRILIDGVDTATRPTSWRRQNIGVVFQDFVRFHFSARLNAGVGWWPDAEDEASVHEAFEKANAADLVARLPGGIESALGTAFGGSDLSGGQWQRVALARLFMRKSLIWLLDEPTAAMDPETEERTFRRFREWTVGRTAIMIAHRLSTVRLADRIAVIHDGRVAEIGTHDELIARGGHYARLFALQAAGYQSGAALAPN